jgi:hypothetical protein
MKVGKFATWLYNVTYPITKIKVTGSQWYFCQANTVDKVRQCICSLDQDKGGMAKSGSC